MIPERVKAIIWMRQKFYFEILPNMDLVTLRLAFDKELEYNRDHPWCDYGQDLEELVNREKGVIVPSFTKYRNVDVRANSTIAERTKKILSKKK